jgi:hypothetical protein
MRPARVVSLDTLDAMGDDERPPVAARVRRIGEECQVPFDHAHRAVCLKHCKPETASRRGG